MAWLKPWCFKKKKQGRNDPPNRGETTHGRNDSWRNDPGRNDPRAKRPGTGKQDKKSILVKAQCHVLNME